MRDLTSTLAAFWSDAPSLGTAALVTFKATSVLLLAAMATAAFRLSAARRHMLWAASIAAAVALPFVTLSLPDWRVPLRYSTPVDERVAATPTIERKPIFTSAGATARTAEPLRVRSGSDAGFTSGSRPPWTWSATIFSFWLVGAVLAFVPWIAGVVIRMRLARSASDLLPAQWERSVHTLRAEGHVPARVRICASASCTMPMTWGTLYPIILLPARSSWHDTERGNALLHELAHVRRADYAVKLLSRVLCVMYWFNPIAWLAARAERLAREQACDDAVLRYGSRPSAYAQQLFDVAQRAPRALAVASLTMARHSGLTRRLRAILDGTHDRSPTGRRLASLAAGALCAIVPPLASLAPEWVRLTGAPNAVVPAERPATEPQALPAPGSRAASVRMVLPQQAACAPTGRKPAASISRQSSDSRRGDQRLTVKWDNGSCRIELVVRGQFTLTPNSDDVAELSAGGYFDLRQNDGGRERRVRIENEGGLERTYWVDDKRVPWSSEASTWLAETIVVLDRRTAFAVDTRLPMLLRRGGVEAVMMEVAQMQSTFPQRIYYSKLIELQPLNAAQLARILNEATRSFDSGYEKAELLLHVARQPAFDQSVHIAYAEMARSIDSDYERRRAFGALLERDDLQPTVVRTMLEASEGMKSDYELAELLLGIERRYAVNEATRPYYVRALESIESDYEQRRVLTAVMRYGGLSSAATQELVMIAGRSMNGYELAEFLVEIARKGTLDQGASSEFFSAARKVGSDYESRRVLQALLSKDDLPRSVIEGILGTAATMKGDYDRAELLIAAARAVKIDEALRPAYEKAASSIKSEYEYGRAMAALRRSGQQR